MRCVPPGGLLRDGPIGRQTAAGAREVLAPKLNGALALGAAAAALPLAGSCLFSSVAALLGNAGQANYAAANGALDTLAASQHAQVSNQDGKAMQSLRSICMSALKLLHPNRHFSRMGISSIASIDGQSSKTESSAHRP